MIEFLTGCYRYLPTFAWNFYVFEAIVIYLVFILFIIFHPAKHVSNIGVETNEENTEVYSISPSDSGSVAGQKVRIKHINGFRASGLQGFKDCIGPSARRAQG
jgi:hypothetical protein